MNIHNFPQTEFQAVCCLNLYLFIYIYISLKYLFYKNNQLKKNNKKISQHQIRKEDLSLKSLKKRRKEGKIKMKKIFNH